MPVLALGLSHRRADVGLLERLAVADDDLPKAYGRLADLEGIREAVVLSTCNRIEVYAEVTGYHAGFQDLRTFLAESSGMEPDEFAEPLYALYEDEAVEHLFGVAAGIDSMIVGEPQILSQVRHAYRRADAESAAGAVLSDLFRRAARFGRRAREETEIGASPLAFVQAGLALAEEALGSLAGRHALVVGAGQMGELALEALRARGIGEAHVLNRTPERAERLAVRHGARARSLTDLAAALASADVVVSSTGAAEQVVLAADVREAMAGRDDRPLFLLDLAVPRDVDPAVDAIAGVSLADIDALRAVVVDERELEEIGKVRALVHEEVRRLAERRRIARLAPLLQALQERGETIRRGELARFRSRLAGLDPEAFEAVEALTRGIVAKLLHDPMVRVKDLSAGGDSHARLLADLFGIEPGAGAGS
ncbi:MAG: glutamyl-tRNA reductase [Actinomycetota bacterium]